MRLFVAEKPDVGRELAAWLGRRSGTTPVKVDHGVRVGADSVTWAFGHLLELAEPDHYFHGKGFQKGKTGKYAWRDIPLPILPAEFALVPGGGDKKKRLDDILRLMTEADEIYNATDIDREGQLIFDEILMYCDAVKGKPIRRLSFSALDDASLNDAFDRASDNRAGAHRNAGLAANVRRQADWLIGINATRAMTLAHPGYGDGVINLGRVVTPTVSIIVRRQREIDAFVPVPVYIPVVEMPDGTTLTWSRRASGDTQGVTDGRITDPALAQRIVDAINRGLAGTITESRSVEKSEPPPLPFSLPSIQSELAKKHGLSVDEITKAAQALYERKMQTYVGTDCRYLPESMHAQSIQVLNGIAGKYMSLTQSANPQLKSGCWNDSMVGGDAGAAHHAIIPTGASGQINSEAERLVYDAVCRRYIAQFHPDHKYLSISLVSEFGADEFKSTARVSLSPGWRAVDDVEDPDADRDAVEQRVRAKVL